MGSPGMPGANGTLGLPGPPVCTIIYDANYFIQFCIGITWSKWY